MATRIENTEQPVLIRDVIDVIRSFAPEKVQESWDNSGLCIGDENAAVTGVLLGFDCTPELVDEAVETGANLIVTHHPLIFGGMKRITPDDLTGLAVMKAIRAGIAVYSAHTSADKVAGGVSWAIASKLGLKDVSILEVDRTVSTPDAEYGLGIAGNLPEPVPAEEIVKTVKAAFRIPVVKSSRLWPGLMVSRVAACGGSGSSLIQAARASGAQLYISGDISYHHFFIPGGFVIMDIGHYESEIAIVDILFSLIQKNFSTFAVRITRNGYANPIYYF